jgi:Holliday junction resolvase RusA-like endonuclease
MTPLSLFIAGLPKGQPRPKACIRGRHAGVYDPGTAEEWKCIIRQEVKAKWDGVPFSGPVHLNLVFNMPRPQSHFGKNGLKVNAPRHHIGKPDADNLTKAVMDALSNLGVWDDDSTVAMLVVDKRYCPQDSKPGVWLSLQCLIPASE